MFLACRNLVVANMALDNNIHICYDIHYLKTIVKTNALDNNLLLFIFSDDHKKYILIYIDWILYLFKETGFKITTVIYDVQNIENSLFLNEIPSKSIMILIEAIVKLDLNILFHLRLESGLKTNLFIINNEQPWENENDKGFIHNSHLAYQYYNLVLRNYYYEDYKRSSHYLPLGVPVYNKILNNITDIIPSSKRFLYCTFNGRFTYDNPSKFHYERRQILDMISENRFPCSIISQNTSLFTGESISNHIDILKQTIFAPCPAGNNPETFRHYEALETGAIPIFVTPPDEVNFLKDWEGYPGPILQSWDEFPDFLKSISIHDVDKLQMSIIDWYKDYKSKTILGLKQLIVNNILMD
jgi:hypothetical protein